MSTALAPEKPANPVAKFSRFMDSFKPQMALALPKHLSADRMARLALTQFSSTPKLRECDPHSIAGSIMTASTLGLEPGVNGQGYLVPYYDKRKKALICQFIPGWKGLVDIANRSGRCTVWTGAVFKGDHFEYALGDRPFVQHRPGDEDRPEFLTHVYAIGRVNGSDWPVIEVWTMNKVWRHRDNYNKVGESHYSFRDSEMYARKVPLLQVLKYMPSSIELSNALTASHAAEEGRNLIIDGNFVSVDGDTGEIEDREDNGNAKGAAGQADEGALPTCSPEDFERKKAGWKSIIEKGTKSVNDLIATIQSKELLTNDQKVEMASWVPASEGAAA